MAERNKHLFRFAAHKIAEAARAEASYHRGRETYWNGELDFATATVERTAGVSVKRVSVTGGWQPQVTVDYGDPAAYARMNLAAQKIQAHRTAADQFESDARLYSTQGEREYDLDGADVAQLRLNGRPRDE